MGILVPRPGTEPNWEHALGPPALGAWDLSHWTTRHVPMLVIFKKSPDSQFKIRLAGLCYGLNVWPLPSYVAILTNLVMVFGGRAFGSDEVMRIESS